MKMTDPFAADDAATPLTPEERADLIPTHVTLRSELNELEQQNIADANGWRSGASVMFWTNASCADCTVG